METIGFQIAEAYNEVIDTTLCAGESLEFRGEMYDVSTEVSVPSLMPGCDSTFNIIIEFETQVPGLLEGIFCIGEVVDVFDMSYSNDTMYTETFIGEGVNGCDSIVDINITFQSVAVGIVNPTLCQNETLTIEGQVFDISNTSDDILIPNGSVFGCDSLIDVDIILLTV